MNEPLDVEALTGRYGPMVLRRCRQLLRDEDEAMDACQDVFVRLLERRGRIDARHPSSLLYITATNVCLNRIRDRRRHAVPTDDDELERIAAAETPAGESDARLLLDRFVPPPASLEPHRGRPPLSRRPDARRSRCRGGAFSVGGA